jgi:hypothetical protein
LFGAGWKVCNWRWESKENAEIKALNEKMIETQKEWDAERLRWEAASNLTASQLSTMETQKDSLLATINGLKLTRVIKVEPNAQGECESAVLDDTFRVRWNAVVKSAASSAAANRRQ